MKRLLDQADLPEYAVHENSPNADDWTPEGDEMTRSDVIRLAGEGDSAALDIIESCLECYGEIGLFNDMSEGELTEAYFYFQANPLQRDVGARIYAALARLTDSINARCDAEQRAARLRYIFVRRSLGQQFRYLRRIL